MHAQSQRLFPNAIWAAVTLVIVAGWVYWGTHWGETGWDFTMFYVAAHTPIGSIHDQTVFQETGRRVLAGTGVSYVSAYVRPAVFALPLRLMRGLPYWEAYRIWACLQFLCYGATLWGLWRRFGVPVSGVYQWALFFPAFFGIITGQDSLALGLVLCWGLVMLTDGRDEAGGALLSLTLYKFNLFLLIPVYFGLRKRYRALAAYALCGGVLACVSILLAPPSVYLGLLPNFQDYAIGFSPKTMPGLRGLCATAGWGSAYPFLALPLSFYLLLMSRRMEFVRGFGMIVTAGVLCAYYVTWYDGAVLALPFGLALARSAPRLRALTTFLMVLLFWNVLSTLVAACLLGFAVLYSVDLGKAANKGATE